MKRFFLLLALCLTGYGVARAGDTPQADAEGQILFATYQRQRPYRIPAIATTRKGELLAISDDRYCGADIGYGRVDLVYKVSKDQGRTWTPDDLLLLEGDGVDASNTCGYGDAAVCADRTSQRIMLMAVSAPKGGICWRASQRGVITWGTPDGKGGWKWETPIDIKDEIMALLPADRINYFVGSGKISQSRIVKKGRYYRVYVALWTTNGYADDGLTNYVIYSDEFGKPGSWKLLGEKNVRPIPGGDEPKAEELPDGSVVLSGRKAYGRYYNIFHFADKSWTEGQWDQPVASHDVPEGLRWGANSTNGEIMVVKAKHRKTGRVVPIVMQSAPAGDSRTQVCLWYKILDTPETYSTPQQFSKHWVMGKEFTRGSSAYSTMTVQKDGRIGFFYEDGTRGADYDMKYVPVDISELQGLADYRLLRK